MPRSRRGFVAPIVTPEDEAAEAEVAKVVAAVEEALGHLQLNRVSTSDEVIAFLALDMYKRMLSYRCRLRRDGTYEKSYDCGKTWVLLAGHLALPSGDA